jgi:mRNA interferase RelE/StbE
MWEINYSKNALKQLKKMDRSNSGYIVSWIEKNLVGCENPRLFGKALVGDLQGLWRYRAGNYRMLAKLEDEQCIILFVDIGHRKDIYK